MPSHTLRHTRTVDTPHHRIHVVVYDDGFGVLTVTNTATGQWHGEFVHNPTDADDLFTRVQHHATWVGDCHPGLLLRVAR